MTRPLFPTLLVSPSRRPAPSIREPTQPRTMVGGNGPSKSRAADASMAVVLVERADGGPARSCVYSGGAYASVRRVDRRRRLLLDRSCCCCALIGHAMREPLWMVEAWACFEWIDSRDLRDRGSPWPKEIHTGNRLTRFRPIDIARIYKRAGLAVTWLMQHDAVEPRPISADGAAPFRSIHTHRLETHATAIAFLLETNAPPPHWVWVWVWVWVCLAVNIKHTTGGLSVVDTTRRNETRRPEPPSQVQSKSKPARTQKFNPSNTFASFFQSRARPLIFVSPF